MPESDRHFARRVLLYQIARRWLAPNALVASEQFVYFDPTDPRKCLSPDLALRVGTPTERTDTWKTWERGAPQVGVEIASPTEGSKGTLASKLERYRQAGIAEVVNFDPDDATNPLRFWDLVDGDLVERDPSDPEAHRCDALGLYWCVRWDPDLLLTLRLAHDSAGTKLLPAPEETEQAALARIAELEAELARRG